MAFSIIVFERIQNKWVKEDSVGVLLGVLLKNCNINDWTLLWWTLLWYFCDVGVIFQLEVGRYLRVVRKPSSQLLHPFLIWLVIGDDDWGVISHSSSLFLFLIDTDQKNQPIAIKVTMMINKSLQTICSISDILSLRTHSETIENSFNRKK